MRLYKLNFLRCVSYLALLTLITACGGDSEDTSNSNQRPVADAGVNQSVITGNTVSLSGELSDDADGDLLTYLWLITARPDGSNAALGNASTVTSSFIADIDGEYVIQLVVNDGLENSTADMLVIISSSGNAAPVSNAGPNQNITTGQVVQLNAVNSSDANNDSLTYSWSFSSIPTSSSASLNNNTLMTPTFTADVDGSYELQLTVNDGQVDSAVDTVVVTSATANSAPVSNAGPNQNVTTGQVVQLTAAASSDSNDDALSYSWSFSSRPFGSNAILSSSSIVNPTFTVDVDGSYVVHLLVNDGQVNSSVDSVTITSSTPNTAPTANAGVDRTVTTGQLVQLNGAASADINDDDLSYSWVFSSRPGGSSASLNNATVVNPTFTADVDGAYALQLTVNDGQADSSVDSVTITSSTVNTAPTANAGVDQTVTTSQSVQLSGSLSSDPQDNNLTYSWSFTSRPNDSSASLDSALVVDPIFVPDVDGAYTLSLTVNDGALSSPADTVVITASATVAVSDDFAGNGALLGYTTNNPEVLPGVTRTDGRYRALLDDNTDNKTLHYNNDQGRLDAKLVSFPFEYIARNIGIGTTADSQVPPASTGNPLIFAGVQVHVTDLNSRNSSHVVVGHRGSGRYLTVEGKNTLNGSSRVDDAGLNVVPGGRADLRIVGNANRTLTVYWQLPNLTGNSTNDNWGLYRNTGNLPGTAPTYADSVYIGLITYAQFSIGLPFVGTADAVEFIQN